MDTEKIESAKESRTYLFSLKASEEFGYIIMEMKDGTTKLITGHYPTDSNWKNEYKWDDKIVVHIGTDDDILRQTSSLKKQEIDNIVRIRLKQEEKYIEHPKKRTWRL